MSEAVHDTIVRAVSICRRHAMIKAAYIVQVYAPQSNQTTSPVLALELGGPLPPDAFAAWPAEQVPLVVIQLNDDVWSRFIRLTTPVYQKPDSATGRGIAESIATLVDGTVRELPSRDHTSQYAIALPDGRMPVLVRDFSHSVGVCLLGGESWHVPARADGTQVAADAAAAARAWATAEETDRVSIVHAAIDLCAALASALGEKWTISVPGTNDPSEMWLHGSVHEAASVGVFRGSARVWLDGNSTTLPIGARESLADAAPKVVARVRDQIAAFAKHLAIGEQIRAIANQLAALVASRLPASPADPSWFVAEHGFASSDRAITASIVAAPNALQEITIRAEAGTIFGHAGVVGPDGWDGELVPTKLALAADEMVEAIARARATLQIEMLTIGERYRVIESIQERFVAGSIVTYTLFDDIDNHYGRYVFADENNNECVVAGDLSTPRNGPLGEVHRFLQRL